MKVKTIKKSVPSLLLLVIYLIAALEVEVRATVYQQIVMVRGKIERQGKPNYPAAYVPVQLNRRLDQGRGFMAYTGPDGLYYFRVAPGDYVLKVKISERESKSYLIKVKAQKTVDVGLIVIP